VAKETADMSLPRDFSQGECGAPHARNSLLSTHPAEPVTEMRPPQTAAATQTMSEAREKLGSKTGNGRKLILGYVLPLQELVELGVGWADSVGVTGAIMHLTQKDGASGRAS
jgi:hypothetical protein